MARRFFWLTVIILFVLTGYTGGWYWAAGRLVDEVKVRTGRPTAAGQIDCVNPEARGFPFRIGLFCDSVAFESPGGFALSTGPLRSAAQVYNPFRIIAETDSPSQLMIAGLVPFNLSWQAARASARLATPFPETVSTEVTELAVTAGIEGNPLLASASRLELHLRPASNGSDLDAALRFEALKTGAILTGGTLAPLSGVVDLRYEGGIARVGRDIAGARFIVRSIEIEGAGGAKIRASGTAAVGDNRLIDATLMLTAENVAGLAAILSQAFPAIATQISTAAAGLSALGEKPTLPLTITDGAISLGFLPLGSIPPL